MLGKAGSREELRSPQQRRGYRRSEELNLSTTLLLRRVVDVVQQATVNSSASSVTKQLFKHDRASIRPAN